MWLLKAEVLERMRFVLAKLSSEFKPTAEERKQFADAWRDANAARDSDAPRNMTVAGDVAEIEVAGVLTERPECFAVMLGEQNTTYTSIRKALAKADADPKIKRIVLNVDSPGGHVHGLFETLAAIEATQKDITVKASLAASAAYAIAAVAGPIEAVGPASEFGSIGVAVRAHLDADTVDIASTEAPNKRPDLSTEEGQAVVRQELDAIHELFADAIARGRDTTVSLVNQEFGRGSVFLAAQAKKRGMIDRIAKAPPRAARYAKKASDEDAPKDASATTGGAVEQRKMTKEELKAQHPELYAAVQTEAVNAERDRVTAHLTMGESSGDMKTAITAIKDGSGMTAALQAQYFSAAMNRRDIGARQADSDDAGKAADGAKPSESAGGGEDLAAAVVARMAAARGKKVA